MVMLKFWGMSIAMSANICEASNAIFCSNTMKSMKLFEETAGFSYTVILWLDNLEWGQQWLCSEQGQGYWGGQQHPQKRIHDICQIYKKAQMIHNFS